ncbi:hypothetical protein ACQYAD_12725 [Neobacillus sp. SM06]|uniref:hypothetical protein n=1 Tax=Neobacillus sp. SM06 TaxID=3422492 RepID=UPI003D2ABB24
MLVAFPILVVYLLFFIFVIYFLVRVLRFMDEKTMLEKERNANLLQIVKQLEQLNTKDD